MKRRRYIPGTSITALDKRLEEQGLITVRRACMMVSRSWTTIWRAIKAGKIEGTRIGTAWYANEESVRRYIGPAACKALGLRPAPPRSKAKAPDAPTQPEGTSASTSA